MVVVAEHLFCVPFVCEETNKIPLGFSVMRKSIISDEVKAKKKKRFFALRLRMNGCDVERWRVPYALDIEGFAYNYRA